MDRGGGILRQRTRGNSGGTQKAMKGSHVKQTSGYLSVCKLVFSSILALLAYLAYLYWSSPISATVIANIHDVRKLKWAKVSNKDLEDGRKVLIDLIGPESIAVDSFGNWYTGLHDGRVLKIIDGDSPNPKVVDLTELANYTAGGELTKKRALGLRLVQNKLFIADAYQGIFVIDIDTFKWEKMVGYDEVSPPLSFPDDLTVSSDGRTIYFTDISLRWTYDHVAFCTIEGECSGRVIKVDVHSRKAETVRDGLCFPNGIELNREETAVAVSETTRRRITVLDIETGATIKHVLLPGGGDNIRPRKAGGYWITIPAVLNPALDIVNDYPFFRDIIASLLGEKGLFKLANFKQGAVVKLDESFEPLSIHWDQFGKVCQALTEVQEYDQDRILMGSFLAPGIVVMNGIAST